jgi:hypothetical protein
LRSDPRRMDRPSLMFKLSICLITGISRHWYPIVGRSHLLVSIRGSVHLIPGHPTINVGANLLFQEYQRQAAGGEIQFRRWPLRAVSLACVYPHCTCILTFISINVWIYNTKYYSYSQQPFTRQRTAVVELLFTKQ